MTAIDQKSDDLELSREPEAPQTSRRELATLLGAIGTLGIAALAGCDPGAQQPLGTLAQALPMTDLQYVVSIADLRAFPTSSPPVRILVLGYYAAGDGGGGLFHWDATKVGPDDLGVVIKPTGFAEATPGRWIRDIQPGIVSVRWFGAKGDGTTSDGAAVQAAIDFVAAGIASQRSGNTVLFPPGLYKLEALVNQAALRIVNNNVHLVGVGGPPYGGARLIVHGPGDGIWIEGAAIPQAYPPGAPTVARGSQIRNLAIYSGSTPMRDAIVVHIGNIVIADCFIHGAARHGILIESSASSPSGLVGGTAAPTGSYINSNCWRLNNVGFQLCGNWQSGGGNPAQGAAVYIHGDDTNGGLATGVFAQACNVGFFDDSLAGAAWVGCGSESSQVGFKVMHGTAAVLLGCTSEDVVRADFAANSPALTLGGSISDWAGNERVGAFQSRLKFETTGTDSETYKVDVPGRYNSAVEFSRGSSTWSLSYQPTAVNKAFQEKSWRWIHRINGAVDVATTNNDPYGGPFGWTEVDNPRGGSLPFIANPLINTYRRWSWRQPNITLQPGGNVIYIWGGTADWGAVLMANPATSRWPNAQTRVGIDVECADLTALNGLDVRVAGYTFIPKPAGERNIAAKIINGGGTAVTVTLLWHFELFVPNHDTTPV